MPTPIDLEITTPFGEISWVIPDQIPKGKYIRDATLTNVKEHMRLFEQHFITNGKALPVLVDIRCQEGKNANKQTRDYLASPEVANITKAAAVLIGNPITKMIGNIFIKFNKPSFPTQLFTDETKALNWLKTFL